MSTFVSIKVPHELVGETEKTEDGYYTYDSDKRVNVTYNSDQRPSGIHKAREVRLAVQGPIFPANNISKPPGTATNFQDLNFQENFQQTSRKVKHVEVKVLPSEAANAAVNNRSFFSHHL